MADILPEAPGAPGIAPRWTSSAKSGVGTSLSPGSRVWFTLSHGILNEVYYPRIDRAAIRDLGFIVAGGGAALEEKRDLGHQAVMVEPGVPAYRLQNVDPGGRFRLDKEILVDPRREVVLQQVDFAPLQGRLADFRLYVLLAPHLGNHGAGNTAWLGDYKGVSMLFAERDGTALALACSTGWRLRSAGFAGVSDNWRQLMADGRPGTLYGRAVGGNTALLGEVALAARGRFVLALGFGQNAAEAGNRALASLQEGFDSARDLYLLQWRRWHGVLEVPTEEPVARDLVRVSAAVLRCHEEKRFPGGLIASLSIPWGFARGDEDLGGYHLVWPRDLVEAAGGLLAAGAAEDVRRVLYYLQSTQEQDGRWAQNMWLDGTPYWSGVQMDETALPILLVDLARRQGALDRGALRRLWPMVRRAAGFVVRNGPVTQQDRWEEDPGYSPFTLAAEIAGLLAAADLADEQGEGEVADYLRETADAWNEAIERWIYVEGTALARQVGVPGYYVRIAPAEQCEAATLQEGFVAIKNRPPGESDQPATNIISPDALALVRFGLRGAADERIVSTVRVIDALLRVETPVGPAWHRYNDDGYGEHDDGAPFDGTGTGRAWPLLTGERGHYELAAGRPEQARRLLAAMAGFAGDAGLIPEQIWDGPDLAQRELHFGRPSGSAMPLVWAHAEYLKLHRSLREGRLFDLPPQPVQRYQVEKRPSPHGIWRFNHKCRTLTPGQVLRLELLAAARVHWSADNWSTTADLATRDSGLGVHWVDLPTAALPAGSRVVFTFFWPGPGRWEGSDFSVAVTV